MRLFIAIRLSKEMLGALKGFQRKLKEMGVDGNYSLEENLHVTLAFIGEYSKPEDVLDAMEEVSLKPFDIQLSGVGCFRDLYWAGLKENRQLEGYVRRLRRSLSHNGIPFDNKRFKAHITLIRKAYFRHGDKIPSLEVPEKEMRVDRICLMKSERGKHGMIYTEIGCIEAE